MGAKQLALRDRGEAQSAARGRFGSVFGARDGLFTPLQRAQARFPDAGLVYSHPDGAYAALMAQALRGRVGAPDGDALLDSGDLSPGLVLDRLARRVIDDVALLRAARGDEFAQASPATPGVHLLGAQGDILVHHDAQLLPGLILDAREGPIVIDARARVGQFSTIQGPAYVGPDAWIDNARILGSVIGRACRIGGEVEASIFGDFSNKHHEGFVGHSLVGDWVNLGALTTTSDLKNNYGEIRICAPADAFDLRASLAEYNTGRVKFGAVIGDCVKTAIGTMINTGSIIDAGANVFDMRPGKYTPPFAWGTQGVYALDKFLADCEKIFARRKQAVTPQFAALATYLWTKTRG
jgi:glucose-1-phosphate thymidylyltransferase